MIPSWFVIAAGLVLIGCAPKGALPLRPNKDHAGENRQAELTANSGVDDQNRVIPKADQSRPGLAPNCSLKSPDSRTNCVVCRTDDLMLERCFGASRINPAEHCQYDRSELRCSIPGANEPLRLSFVNSEEKNFLRNFPLITSTMKSIVADRMAVPDAQTQLFYTWLDFADQNMRAIIIQGRTHDLVTDFRRVVGQRIDDPNRAAVAEKNFVDGCAMLREAAVSGQLDAKHGVTFLRNVATQFLTDKQTLELLTSISVDGLAGSGG